MTKTIHYNKNNKDIEYDIHKASENTPWVICSHGSRSNKEGPKIKALEAYCKRHSINFIAYNGDDSIAYVTQDENGAKNYDSLINATISSCTDVLNLMINEVAEDNAKILLVGASMGLWLSLLGAIANPDKIIGIVGVAGSVDFTENRIWANMSGEDQAKLQNGEIVSVSGFEQGIKYDFIEDGRKNLLLDKEDIPVACPVILIYGTEDTVVNCTIGNDIKAKILSDAVTIKIVEGSNHGMNDQNALKTLVEAVDTVLHDYDSSIIMTDNQTEVTLSVQDVNAGQA